MRSPCTRVPAHCCLQVLGGNGYVNDYPTGRILRDAKLYEIGAGECCVCGASGCVSWCVAASGGTPAYQVSAGCSCPVVNEAATHCLPAACLLLLRRHK